MKSRDKSLVYYFQITFLSTVPVLISIPFIIKHFGVLIWTEIAIGQTIGGVTSIAILLGSAISGPHDIALATLPKQKSIIAVSSRYRLIVFLPTLSVTLILAHIFSFNESAISSISAFIVLLSSLSLSWVLVGRQDPREILRLESAPKAFGTLIGIAFAVYSQNLFVFFACQVISIVYSLLITLKHLEFNLKEFRKTKVSKGEVFSFFKSQVKSTKVVVFAMIMNSFPALFLFQTDSTGYAYFSIGERLLKVFQLLSNPVLQWFQGWTSTNSKGSSLKSKVQKSIRYFTLLGACSAGFILFLGEFSSAVISNGDLSLPTSALIPISASVFFSFVSKSFGVIGLVSYDLEKSLSNSALMGLILMIPILIFLTTNFSYTGTLWSITLVQASITLYQIIPLQKSMSPYRFMTRPNKSHKLEID